MTDGPRGGSGAAADADTGGGPNAPVNGRTGTGAGPHGPDAPPPAPPADDSFVLEAGAEAMAEICERALDELGTTVPPTQLRALLIVERLGGPNLNSLAQELRASMSATSRLCDRLQAAGLIARRAAARDRREVVISLSQAGARLAGWAHEQRRGRLTEIARQMDEQDRAALVRGLRAFEAAAARREAGIGELLVGDTRAGPVTAAGPPDGVNARER